MSRRVALIVPAFPALSETFIVRQWLAMLDAGWDAHIVCARFQPEIWQRHPTLKGRPELRSRVRAVGPTSSWRALAHAPRVAVALAKHPRRSWRYGRVLGPLGWKRVLKRFYLDAPLIALNPDLVHFEFGSLAVSRMDLGNALDTAIVVSFRGFDLAFVGLEQEDFYDEVWDKADGLHFLGGDLFRRAVKRGCPPNIDHELIPPAVDAARFTPRSSDTDPAENVGSESGNRPLRILSVGRLVWKKGYEYGVRAIRHLVDAGVPCTYTLVGGGPESGAVAYARHQLNLVNEVDLRGPVSHDEVLAELRRADVFLHPAVSEGFCNAVMEAQAMCVPVVTTDADGLPENVADGETGFVVPRRDPAALADALKRLAQDPELRKNMGAAGRRRVQEIFRPELEAQGFDRLYRRALETYRAKQR